MSSKPPAKLPSELSAAYREIGQWRRRRGHQRERMPETLWRRAAALAGEYGLNPTARALKLNYYSLKKRLAEMASEETAPASAPPDFIEIPPDILKSAPVECTIEWIDGSNSTVRMHIQGAGLSELTALVGVLRDGKE
jgi:hypothetical protein